MESIILFGASNLGINYLKSVRYKNSNIYFCDNDKNKWGKIVGGIKVISPKDILKFSNPKVIITSMYYREIQKQLVIMGIYNISKAVKTPMDKVIDMLIEKGSDIKQYSALEVFGGDASFHTLDYACLTKDIEIWEIDNRLKADILNNVPFAEVNIVDSYKEITKINNKYDLVVVDNPLGIYDDHCEHFDLFPHITNVLNDEAILILNIIPSITRKAAYKYPYLLDERYLQSRCDFYGISDSMNISLNQMVNIYITKFKNLNFKVSYNFNIKRTFLYYLVFKLNKIKQ